MMQNTSDLTFLKYRLTLMKDLGDFGKLVTSLYVLPQVCLGDLKVSL